VVAEDTYQKLESILESVVDPEIPVLTIADLGILRKFEIVKDPTDPSREKVIVTITPTYSGCPAMDMITTQIRMALLEHGYTSHEIITQLSPAWTTDWMSEEGKQKLKAYGIAAPAAKTSSCASMETDEQLAIQCPHCNSYHTELKSRYGSTACKALYQCRECLEPFDYFKCH
jgi:ring-1,2-phenylacetyl-CoA epoxidase subunit PaaD